MVALLEGFEIDGERGVLDGGVDGSCWMAVLNATVGPGPVGWRGQRDSTSGFCHMNVGFWALSMLYRRSTAFRKLCQQRSECSSADNAGQLCGDLGWASGQDALSLLNQADTCYTHAFCCRHAARFAHGATVVAMFVTGTGLTGAV